MENASSDIEKEEKEKEEENEELKEEIKEKEELYATTLSPFALATFENDKILNSESSPENKQNIENNNNNNNNVINVQNNNNNVQNNNKFHCCGVNMNWKVKALVVSNTFSSIAMQGRIIFFSIYFLYIIK
jgi:hypothetical protein